MSARSPGVRKGPDGALECLGGRRYAGWGSGWALAIPMCAGRVGGREVVPTHPVYPSLTNPGIPPSRYPPAHQPAVHIQR